MRSVCLTLSRLFAAAWCGAGVLFVVILVSMRASELFDDETKLRHPLVLFPVYYKMEFVCLLAALVLGVMAIGHPQLRLARGLTYVGLLALALLLATIDYFAIYLPLTDMVRHSLLTAEFRPYHTASRWVNTAGLLISLGASVLSLIPVRAKSGLD